jgi:pimeloyl-ACP methyl ester carboxylesterase
MAARSFATLDQFTAVGRPWIMAVVFGLSATLFGVAAQAALSDDSQQVLSIDHFVQHASSVPAIAAQPVQLYVRERVQAGTIVSTPAFDDRVVLFVHGAGTPAEVGFDVAYADYSWMAFVAQAGYDVFSVDMTGYGRSTRPAPMDDPCNLATEQQSTFIPSLIPETCAPSYPRQMTSIQSDWDDIGAVVDYVRGLRHVDQVSLVAWSLGGPRAGGYAARHVDQIRKLVLLAPVYSPNNPPNPPLQLPAEGVAMNTQSHDEFIANWDRQVGCGGQYDPAVAALVWSSMLESDAVGSTWGPGVRRAPAVTTWGWNLQTASGLRIPTLMVSGEYDKQVNPDSVRQLWTDLGSTQKVFVDLACSSHNAMWEINHTALFQMSVDWLNQSSVNGVDNGTLRIGD